jgi:steroid delta-isomerase-like uncharacterized protein
LNNLLTKENAVGTSESKRIFDDWAKAWSSGDPEKVLALFTENCFFEDVTFGVVIKDKEALRDFAKGAFAAVPDLRFELTSWSATDHNAAIEWTMSGTHKGDFPGLPATGKRFSVRGSSIFELTAGKIRRESDYWDAATFMKQVGLGTPA